MPYRRQLVGQGEPSISGSLVSYLPKLQPIRLRLPFARLVWEETTIDDE